MLAFRYFAAMSTGAALALAYASASAAQTPAAPVPTASESPLPAAPLPESAPATVDTLAAPEPPVPVAARTRAETPTPPALASAPQVTADRPDLPRADELSLNREATGETAPAPQLSTATVPPLFASGDAAAPAATAAPTQASAFVTAKASRLTDARLLQQPSLPVATPVLALADEPAAAATTTRTLAVDEVGATAIARAQPPLSLAATDDSPRRRTELAPPVAPSLAPAVAQLEVEQLAPLKVDEPAAAPRWLAQADAPDRTPTDELSAPVEPLFQDFETLTPAPDAGEIRDDAAPLTPRSQILDGRQEVVPPETLNPSANPLLFPTEPDEVTVDLTQPITLLEAIALARRNNQSFRTAWLNLEKAQAGLRAARASLFPTLDATTTLSRTDSAQSELANRSRQDSAVSDLLGNQNNDTITDSIEGRVELSYNLYDGGRRPAQIREAERAIRFNQLEVERIDEQIRLQTTNTYYALQEADARVEIEQAAVENAQQTLRDAELLEQAGLGTRFDVLRAEVSLANSNQALTNALSEQRISRRELVQVLGLGQQVEVSIADEIEPAGTWPLPLEDTIVLAYRNRAELEQQLVQREIDEQQRQAALADIRPQVSVFANYNVLGVFNDSEGLADGYQIGARVRWRFFDGGLARARSDQEAVDIEIAEVTFEQRRNEIRLEVEEAYSNLQASDENIKTATVAVQLAEESLRLARLRFQAGVGTQTDVIDAQTELTRAQGNLLTAIVGYNSALASLRRAVSNVPDNRLFDVP